MKEIIVLFLINQYYAKIVLKRNTENVANIQKLP